MDDSTVLSVATGRKTLLRQVLKTLEDNLWSSSIAQHLLIRGPRGMGKSFFLKYLQINFRKKEVFEDCEFLLLPEEQNNINSPTDLIKLILSELQNESGAAAISLWEEPNNLWQIELKKLKELIAQKKGIKTNYQLVVVIENLDEFLKNIKQVKKTRQTYESRFRHLLEKINDFTIIGATPRIDSDAIDGDYNQRLFHAFKKCNLKRWTEEDYFNYFERRQLIKEKEKGVAYSNEQTNLMRAKLKALSHYTGGSPRMAVVLTNLLLEDDVISTAKTLFGLIDDLTPYYQDLTKSIPPKSKILFDTLIRKEENLSQSELAKIVGATQSKISKAFLWLKDNGYIIGKKRSNSPAFSYHVADRIHVLYYQLREIHHNKNITPIWLLSDFLVAFYQEEELREHALRSLREQPGLEANDLARVYLLSSGFIKKETTIGLKNPKVLLELIKQIPIENKKIKSLIGELKLFVKEEKGYNIEFKNRVKEVFHYVLNIRNVNLISYYLQEIEILSYELAQKENYSPNIFLLNHLLHARLKEDNNFNIATTTQNLGFNLVKSNNYEEAIIYHKRAIELWMKEKNTFWQSWNLGIIGVSLMCLRKHDEALEFHKESLELCQESKDPSWKIFNLGRIGENLKFLKKYNQAILYHNQALSVGGKKDYLIEKIWNLGHIGSNYIMLNKWNEAENLLNPSFKNNEAIFRRFGDSVILLEESKNSTKAFEFGVRLFNILSKKRSWINVGVGLNNLVTFWLNKKISHSLFKDLAEEALIIFPEPDTQLIINAALNTINYIENGKTEAFLETLNPDMAIAVKAIIQEIELVKADPPKSKKTSSNKR